MELDGISRGQVVQTIGFVERIHLVIKRRRAGGATPGSSGRDLERATRLSVHGSANQPISATAFVKHILLRAEKEGGCCV